MKILITGGAGFAGSQLAFYLNDRGHAVLVLDNLVRRGSEINLPLFRRQGITFYHGDVRNREDFAQLPPGIELICDASAQPSAVTGYANPYFDFNNNVFGLLNVLEYARLNGCGLIFWSTNRVYSAKRVNAFPLREEAMRYVWDTAQMAALPAGFDPAYGFSEQFNVDGGQHSIYGLSKTMADLACQEYAHAYGVPTVVNRFGCLAGPGQFGKSEQGWVAWWVLAFHFGLPLRYIGWQGKQVRDVLFIDDMCRLVELQIGRLEELSGEVFNIGGGKANAVSLRESTALLQELYGREIAVSVDAQARKADFGVYFCDIRKAERLLGWRPQTSVAEGFAQIRDWVSRNEDALRGLYVSS
jgi:CDP-paratose 2-epimerase